MDDIPEDHIGQPEGIATKQKLHADVMPGKKPNWPVAEDSHNFYLPEGLKYNAPVDFLATRENIERFSATAGKSGAGLAVVKNADVATHCQMAVEAELNARPRKTLYYRTPEEVMQDQSPKSPPSDFIIESVISL